jgi:predicted metal-binding protein
MIALHLTTALLMQECQMCCGLETFGNGLEIQAVRHLNECSDDGCSVIFVNTDVRQYV